MAYQKRLHTTAVTRLSDNAIIGPEDKEDWDEYKLWLSAGNKPLPAEKIKVVKNKNKTVEDKLNSLGLTKEELLEFLGL